jgi:hypothetical protein
MPGSIVPESLLFQVVFIEIKPDINQERLSSICLNLNHLGLVFWGYQAVDECWKVRKILPLIAY